MIKMKHYELEISRFVDNELPPDEQKMLFAHLTDCEECRGTLSDFMEMKKESRSFYESIDVELKPAIKLPAEVESRKEGNIYKSLFYFSAAASVILGLLFLMKQSSVDILESEYSSLKVKYNELISAGNNVQKNNFTNEMKAAGVSSKKKKVSTSANRVKNLAVNKTIKNLPSRILLNESRHPLQKSQQIQIVQVTKNDFLTPQIIGN